MEHAKVARNTMEGVWDAMEGVWDATEGVWDATENASNMAEGTWDVAEDMCARGLIRAANKNRPCNDDEEVEENTE